MFFQAEDGIRDLVRSRGLGDVYKRQPQIAKVLANIFPWMLIDEYQDTKRIQYAVVADIVRAGAERTRLFVVGDPNQAIFGSLGGFAMPVAELRQLCGVRLEERAPVSYTHLRAHETVLDIVCRLLLEQKTHRSSTC